MMPRMINRCTTVLLGLFLFTSTIASAQTRPSSGPSTREGRSGHDGDKLSVTHHELNALDKTLKYEATAGTMTLKDEAGKARANFFFTAYRLEGESDVAKRPLTFVFNGGPGAA